MKIHKLKPIFYLLTGVIFLCFLTFSVSDTLAIRNYSILFLFVSFCCFLMMVIRLPGLASNKQQNSNNSNDNVNDKDIQLLYEILETSIKDELIVIKQELGQIKDIVTDAVKELSSGFYGVSASVDAQQQLVNLIIDAITMVEKKTNEKDKVDKENIKKEKLLSKLNTNTQEINHNVATAVRALQFEDIVIQLSDNSLLCANNIESFLDELKIKIKKQLSGTPLHELAADQIESLLSEAKAIRKEKDFRHEKVISQTNLTEGNIELF